MLNRDEIKGFFNLTKSHAKKELGQNFLCNEKAIQNIVDLIDLKREDSLLEIGPGLGALTGNLVNKTNKYAVVEYDAKFVEFLNKSYSETNIEIVKNNILKFKNYDFNKVIGNLPYYITSEILIYIALNFKKLEKAVCMMQLEAYKRITAKKGTKDYNVLNIILDYVFKITKNMTVVKTSFFPMPQVDSVVITLSKKKEVDDDFLKGLYSCVKAMFLNRRKTLFNNLNSVVKNKEKTKEIIENLGFSINCRAEELELNDFINLTRVLLNLGFLKL